MSKYIRIYNRLTKFMGIVELVYLCTLEKPKINFKNYIYGHYIYCLLEQHKDHNFEMPEKTYYKKSNSAVDINTFADYDKFIMNNSGEIFTTITGYISTNFYYLKDNNFGENFYHEILLETKLKNTNLLRGDLLTVFKLKKKYNLPKFISYLIILELCKLHCKSSLCDKCLIIKVGKKCHNCNKCHYCNTLNNQVYFCYYCKNNYCNKCADGTFCDYCYKNSMYNPL